MSDFYFNVNDPEIQNDFNPLPKGSYNCNLEKVEDRTDKNGNRYIYCVFTVIEGEYRGRKITELLYLFSEKTEKEKNKKLFAKRTMKQMLEAHGMTEIYSPAELAGRNYQIVIDSYIKDGVEKESRRYGKVPAVDITGSPWQ